MSTIYWVSNSSTSFNTAGNWSSGSAPVNSDTIIFNSLGTASVATNLSTSLTGITMIVESSYTGNIGVLSGSTATYLVLDGGTLFVGRSTGQGSGSNSPLVMVNFGSTAAVANVYDSSSTSASTYYPPVLLKGTSLTLNQYGGSVGLAALPGDTATLTAIKMTQGNQPNVSASLYMGAGVTTTLLDAVNGTILNRSDQTQTTVTLGSSNGAFSKYTYDGTGAHTTLTVGPGATAIYSGTGTITTCNVSGTFDRTRDTRALTITDTNLYAGCSFLLDNGVSGSTTRTNAVALIKCGTGDITTSTPDGERL